MGLRGLFDFHYYGRYGGPGWTAGRWASWEDLSDAEKKDAFDVNSVIYPRDAQDMCYLFHDKCYGECREGCKDAPCPQECERKGLNKCDRELRDCLIGVGFSGNKLNQAFRIVAIPVFEGQAANRDARAENTNKGTSWLFKWGF